MPVVMDSVLTALRASSQQVAVIAVDAVWQGAFFAFGLAILLRLAPRTSAEHRFSIWAAAFASLVGLPLLTLFSKFSDAVISGVSSPAANAAAGPVLSRPWLSIDARWSLLIAAIWIAAMLYRFVGLAVHSLRLRKLWEEAIPVELDSRISSMLNPITATWNHRRTEVCTSTKLQRPSVIGFFKPRILIPDWLIARLTLGDLEQIVLHEMEHLRRRDDWTNLLQKLCLVLFPLNPALVWIEHRLCREREMACDEGVVRITGAPRVYAACLTSLAERGLQRRVEALSLGAWQRRPELVHRVHSILRRKHALGPLGNGALLVALGCILLFGSIELARCPQLIAFVPARDLDRSQDVTNVGALVHPQAAGVRLGNTKVNAGYFLDRRGGAGHTSLALHGTKVEVILPVSGSVGEGEARASMKRSEVMQAAAHRSATQSYESNSRSARAILLRAKLSSEQSQSVEGQWAVVTTWEQVQSSNQSANLIADYETGANASTDGRNEAGSESTSQITITRLILRILPASSISNFVSTQPAIVPTGNGWLVFQL
jgi:beta-lactamase regulating signal transducer with metallopeptidase domain